MENKKTKKFIIISIAVITIALLLITTVFAFKGDPLPPPIKPPFSRIVSEAPNDYRIPVSDNGNIVFFNDNTGEALFTINHNGEFIWNVGSSVGKGTLSTGNYDSETDLTLVKLEGSTFPELSLEDAATINISGDIFYVDSIINDTYLYGLGELSFSDVSDWTFRVNSYFSTDGYSTDERGFAINLEGLWQWAMYSPSSEYSNELNFCLASRNNSFADLMCAKQEGIIEFYSPIKLTPTFEKTECNEASRGMIYYVNGETGQEDKMQVCSKDSNDAYSWRDLSFA